MLEIRDLHAGYDEVPVLRGVSLNAQAGELVSLVGANGAGKSTLLRVLSGIVPSWSGQILFEGAEITNRPPHEIVDMGIIQVPEGRKLFPHMSVGDNLLMGAYSTRGRKGYATQLEYVFSLLPVLKGRLEQLAGTLSGGEQQMVAIGRALMARPRLLLLDEPSLGLAPVIFKKIFQLIPKLQGEGITVMLVEQNVKAALELADRAYVLENGEVVLNGTAASLLSDPKVQTAYLGM